MERRRVATLHGMHKKAQTCLVRLSKLLAWGDDQDHTIQPALVHQYLCATTWTPSAVRFGTHPASHIFNHHGHVLNRNDFA